MLSYRSLIAAAVMVVASSVALADLAADFNTINQRLIDEAQAKYSHPADSVIAGYLATLGANGQWSDVNYDDTTGTNWLPSEALNRLDRLGRMYVWPSSGYYHSEVAKAAYLKALDYWFARNPQSSNSWWNKIGGQEYWMDSMLIMKPYMTPTELSQTITYLAKGDVNDPEYGGGGGANVVDLADITIHRGIMENSPTTMQTCFTLMGAAFLPGPSGTDGIMSDGSFQQHGTILYDGGYGLSFIQQAGRYVSLPEGTSFAYSTAEKESLVKYMLAQQWMMRGSIDYSTQGRDVTRSGQQSPGTALLTSLADLQTLNTTHQYELQRMVDRINNGASSTNYLRGNAAFPRTDFITHQRLGWYASVHMVSTRTHGSESGNGEGLKNYYFGDGVNFITRGTYGEYSGIFPVWNWRMLPGTTIEQKTSALPLINWGSGSGGSSNFVGEVSDGSYGASTMTYSRDGVSAKKSWFFFDNEEVALGTDIQAPNATYSVYSTLNQCLTNGTVTVKDSAGQRAISLGTTSNLTNAQWIYHDQTGYVFLANPGNVTVKNASQSGTWYSINNSMSSSTVNKNVFSAWVDHGTRTANGQYAYVVAPGITSTTALDAYAAALPISVLQNDASIQAVRQNTLKVTQAVFRQTNPLTVAPGLTVTPDQKVMVMLQERNFGMQVSVANPAGDPNSSSVMTANLNVTRQLTGSGCTYTPATGISRLQFQLPTLQDAGKTMTKIFDNPIAGPKATAYSVSPTTAVLYNLDDSPGAITITDQSGNGMDLLGSVTNFNDDLGPAGLRASAAFTPGTGTAVKLPKRVLSATELAQFNTNTFTIEAWVKNPNTALASEGLFELGKTGSGKVQFGLQGDKLSLNAAGLNFAGAITTGDLTWLPDTWYHVAVTVDTGSASNATDATVVNFYQTPANLISPQATLAGTLTGTGDLTAFASSGNSLMLGDWDSSDTKIFSGLMDEVRFSNQALSSSQFLLAAFNNAFQSGDTDANNKIDGIDLATLAQNWDPQGTTHTWAQGDFDGNGVVDGIDLASLAQNWNPLGYTGGQVPEPATLSLMTLSALALLRRRRR